MLNLAFCSEKCERDEIRRLNNKMEDRVGTKLNSNFKQNDIKQDE